MDADRCESQGQVFNKVARVKQMIPVSSIAIFPGASIEYGSKEKDQGRGRIPSGFYGPIDGEVNITPRRSVNPWSATLWW